MSRVLYASIREGKLLIKESVPDTPSYDDEVIETYNLRNIKSEGEITHVLKRMRMAYEMPDQFVALARLEIAAQGDSTHEQVRD